MLRIVYAVDQQTRSAVPGDRPRLGAYVLAADPTWIRSSIARYYDYLDVLVVSASASNTGWTGHPIPADECVAVVESLDTRGIVKVVRGEWGSSDKPAEADTLQRQEALAYCGRDIDWVLQIDTDEVLPSMSSLISVLTVAAERDINAVEWPMRVLYRKLQNGSYLEVVNEDGTMHSDYPGPIAVRPGVELVDCRRAHEDFLRPTVIGDKTSMQIARPAALNEVRIETLSQNDLILHNSWARSHAQTRRKAASWGHNSGLRSRLYFFLTWLPAQIRWRRMRDVHPFARGLWPRLARYPGDVRELLRREDW